MSTARSRASPVASPTRLTVRRFLRVKGTSVPTSSSAPRSLRAAVRRSCRASPSRPRFSARLRRASNVVMRLSISPAAQALRSSAVVSPKNVWTELPRAAALALAAKTSDALRQTCEAFAERGLGGGNGFPLGGCGETLEFGGELGRFIGTDVERSSLDRMGCTARGGSVASLDGGRDRIELGLRRFDGEIEQLDHSLAIVIVNLAQTL